MVEMCRGKDVTHLEQSHSGNACAGEKTELTFNDIIAELVPDAKLIHCEIHFHVASVVSVRPAEHQGLAIASQRVGTVWRKGLLHELAIHVQTESAPA